jgi:aminoglycoside/choline kinase family phosphotransferase
MMGGRDTRSDAAKARPILTTRDYDAARQRLVAALGEPGWTREEDRIEALIHVLRGFEGRLVMRDASLAIEWAECVFVPAAELEPAPKRRWSDLAGSN